MNIQKKTLPLNLLILLILHSISILTESNYPGAFASAGKIQTAELTCSIKVALPQERRLSMRCAVTEISSGKMALRFTDKFAGVVKLSERVTALNIRDEKGAVINPDPRGAGVFILDIPGNAKTINIDFDVNLANAFDPGQQALVSSLGPDAGVLMMGDLLPALCDDESAGCEPNVARVKITPPETWKIATTETPRDGYYEIAEPRQTLFFLGKFREKVLAAQEMKFRTVITGEWVFEDREVFKIVEAIGREQAAMVGSNETGEYLVTLAPFPQPLTGLRSSAITIGRTVILLLNPISSPSQTFGHYRKHLAHEMFHFYLPNAFQVADNFDWFWEGFTRYISLATLGRLKRIDLSDYLFAISEEYEAYLLNPARNRVSLIAASPEKFQTAANYELVYRKGMLVGALYDLELRWQSRGRYTIADLMKTLYQDYAIQLKEIGNDEVIAEMGKIGDFKRLIAEDIEGTKDIELARRVGQYGLIYELSKERPGKLTLKKAPKLSERQKQLLESLENTKPVKLDN